MHELILVMSEGKWVFLEINKYLFTGWDLFHI